MFDNVWHGFWKVPCLVAAIGFGSVAYRYRGNFISDVREFMNLPASGIFLCGLLTVLVFSRLFGSNYLWEPLMGEEYIRCAKNMAEEGLELLGYLFTGIGRWSIMSTCISGSVMPGPSLRQPVPGQYRDAM